MNLRRVMDERVREHGTDQVPSTAEAEAAAAGVSTLDYLSDPHIGCMFNHEHRWPECYDDVGRPEPEPDPVIEYADDVLNGRIPGR